MNLLCLPSQEMNPLKDFLTFNGFVHDEYPIWNDDLKILDFDLVQKNTVVIDYYHLSDILTSTNALQKFVQFLNTPDNHVYVYNWLDSGTYIDLLNDYIKNLDLQVPPGSLILTSDALWINPLNFKNIVVHTTPLPVLCKITRKVYYPEIDNKKSFLLTMNRKDPGRDLLWNELLQRDLLSSSNSIYHENTGLVEHDQESVDFTKGYLGLPSNVHSQHSFHPAMDLYQSSYYEIVPETFVSKMHYFTEKSAKAISCRKPFIVVSTPGYLGYLRNLGFKTFDGIIDESYDLESDLERRVKMVVDQVEYIAQIGPSAFVEQCSAIVEHNYHRLAELTGMFDDVSDQFFIQSLLPLTKIDV